MKKSAGKWFREGLGFLEIANMFSDEDKTREWIAVHRWPQGPYRPCCGSTNGQCDLRHKTMPHRLRKVPDEAGEPEAGEPFSGPVEVDETCFGGKREELKDTVRGPVGKRLRYRELVADNSLSGGARS